MSVVLLNIIRLNSKSLNLVGTMGKGASGGGEKAPDGYETFVTADGDFIAADGEFYVKIL